MESRFLHFRNIKLSVFFFFAALNGFRCIDRSRSCTVHTGRCYWNGGSIRKTLVYFPFGRKYDFRPPPNTTETSYKNTEYSTNFILFSSTHFLPRWSLLSVCMPVLLLFFFPFSVWSLILVSLAWRGYVSSGNEPPFLLLPYSRYLSFCIL